MPDLDVDGSVFSFPDDWEATKYDEWTYFTKIHNRITDPRGRGLHGCDVVALHGRELWLIEAKDYAYREAKVPKNLIAVVTEKVIDTLAGLHAGTRDEHDHRGFCERAVRAPTLNVALRIDLPGAQPQARKTRKAKAISTMADCRQGLDTALSRVVNGKIHVVTGRDDPAVVPWTVRWSEERRRTQIDSG